MLPGMYRLCQGPSEHTFYVRASLLISRRLKPLSPELIPLPHCQRHHDEGGGEAEFDEEDAEDVFE